MATHKTRSSHKGSTHKKTSRGKKVPEGAVQTNGFIKPKSKSELAKLRKKKR